MAYSDAERVAALAVLSFNKNDYKKTAELTGVSLPTLQRWSKVPAPKKGISELLDEAIAKMFGFMPERWNGKDWAIAIGIMFDKWFLSQGEPTSRTESVVRGFRALNEDERSAVVERARELIAELSHGNNDGGDR